MNNLTATSKIDLLCPVKITSDNAVTITRGDSFKDAFFETAVSLEIIGTQTAIITFDGGSKSATQPIIYASSDLSLEYCNFINNTNTQTDGGALNINSTSVNTINISNCNFTNNSVTGSLMAGGAVAISSTTAISNFKNCTFENNIAMNQGGGAIYISGNTSNCSEKWTTFEDCTFKYNKSYYSTYDYGGAIYVASGPVSLNTVHMENNFICQGDTDTTGTNSDIYLNGYMQELKLNGIITISTLKIKISTNTPKDIGISEFFDTDISKIENLILAVDTGSVSNVSRPFKIYTYDTVGTNAYSETECTLTNNQINCFNSIYDEQSIYYQLLEDGSIEQKQ